MLPPEKHTFDTIWGHAAARNYVPRLLAAGRLPHAILLNGPDAIGKRSLAFAMAKAILSAGRPVQDSALTAPSPAGAKRRVDPAPEEPADDLFGGSAEADLFGGSGEVDLFASLEPEPPKKPVREPEAPPKPVDDPAPPTKPVEEPTKPVEEPVKPPKPEKKPKAEAAPLRKVPRLVETRTFRGMDDRVCRLVEASYPLAHDKDGRNTKVGHIDLTIIEPIGGRRGIVVDQIRSLHEIAALSPVEGAFRVVLIFGADTITAEGGNSMLKLLEEPPPYLVLILVTDRLSRVLPTIKSRCASVPMAPLDRETLVRKLIEDEKLAPDLAQVAAALSECRPGVALSVMDKELLKRRRDVFQARLQIDRYGVCGLPAASGRIASTGGLDDNLWLLLSYARDRMVRALAPEDLSLLVHGDALDLLDAVALDPVALSEEADRLVKAFAQLAHPYVPNQRAALEVALWPE